MKDQILPKYLNRLTKFLNDHGDRYFVRSEVKLFITYLVINKDILHKRKQLTLQTVSASKADIDPYHASFGTSLTFSASLEEV